MSNSKPISTMSSLTNEFQVTLPSNLNGNPHNKPVQYETTLAKTFDLPGDWEATLIDISYTHKLLDFNKLLLILLLEPQVPYDQVTAKNNTKEFYQYTAAISNKELET